MFFSDVIILSKHKNQRIKMEYTQENLCQILNTLNKKAIIKVKHRIFILLFTSMKQSKNEQDHKSK